MEPIPDGATGVDRDAAGEPARLGTPAATRLVGVSPRTLEKHRIYGTGPNYSKVSGRVFYPIGDLTEWANRGARRSTSDPGNREVLIDASGQIRVVLGKPDEAPEPHPNEWDAE